MNPDKIRNVLNLLFLVLAVATVVVYFIDMHLFIVVGSTAIFLKVMEFIIRFINR